MYKALVVCIFLVFPWSLLATVKHCERCDCDCSWVSSDACSHDDSSCCWGCCCASPPSPPPSSIPPPSAPKQLYCPSADDITTAYGSPVIFDGGWTITGGGGVSTKSSFNILEGYVEFDVDFTATKRSVNANIYSISPYFDGSFTQNAYCDGARTGGEWCAEVDWIESNGDCGGATTLHTTEGPGSDGCTAWGCSAKYYYTTPRFHMKVSFDSEGRWTTVRGGETLYPTSLSPLPKEADWGVVKTHYEQRGALIYSSQWVGWVPMDCGYTGELGASSFSISNLKIYGSVVRGPTPRTC